VPEILLTSLPRLIHSKRHFTTPGWEESQSCRAAGQQGGCDRYRRCTLHESGDQEELLFRGMATTVELGQFNSLKNCRSC
jgi:hypothetical protein